MSEATLGDCYDITRDSNAPLDRAVYALRDAVGVGPAKRVTMKRETYWQDDMKPPPEGEGWTCHGMSAAWDPGLQAMWMYALWVRETADEPATATACPEVTP